MTNLIDTIKNNPRGVIFVTRWDDCNYSSRSGYCIEERCPYYSKLCNENAEVCVLSLRYNVVGYTAIGG